MLSRDGECRVWDLSCILEEDEGDMRFPLVGRFDASACGCAAVLEPRKGLVGEIVIGSATGSLEVWVLPGQDESVRTMTQTCHASSVTCIASYKSGEAYSLLTASDESIVRWVLDDQGLQARERFPVSRAPSSLIILPPLKGGDPDPVEVRRLLRESFLDYYTTKTERCFRPIRLLCNHSPATALTVTTETTGCRSRAALYCIYISEGAMWKLARV